MEHGTLFDMILVDKSLEDAPILGHLRELSAVRGNPDVTISVFANDKLRETVNSDTRQFGKLLMIGLLPLSDFCVADGVREFRESLKRKVILLIATRPTMLCGKRRVNQLRLGTWLGIIGVCVRC